MKHQISDKKTIPFSKRFAYYMCNKFRAGFEMMGSEIDGLQNFDYDDLLHSVIFFGDKRFDEIKDNPEYLDVLFEARQEAERVLFGDFDIVGAVSQANEIGIMTALDDIAAAKELGDGLYAIQGISDSKEIELVVSPAKFTYSAYVGKGDLNGLVTNMIFGNVQKLQHKIQVLLSSVKVVDGDKKYPCTQSLAYADDKFLLSCLALSLKENFNGIKKSTNLHRTQK